ncbi:kinesin-like protein NACK1 [Amborella trichopoda]|uniref:kinesin-like protein NACK1 n=1 Tax=Amborella trichopoda TaxID=13333 RepID=UPI0009C13462|nr:kinesin-like protein NACK1 [Amborella trichopoda]|eukprot:XP_020521637.1 kinesin-like protein NACK1 [Amborella trichopoda]
MTISIQKTPSTPASNIERTPSSTPGGPKAREEKIHATPASKIERTPLSTPVFPKAREEKIHATPASKIERTPLSTPGGPKAREEKILVTVRVRPLSSKELAQRDQIAWECADDHTILFKNQSQERSSSQASYTFDRVFRPECLTERVYVEGAKDVALSALTGINATIFAYGQTSSGKTFTMRGITECAVNDIYRQIHNNPERDFTIKISALEIYNEIVRDLLKPDSGPLRLLDDPEKGTVVDKLIEETASDSQHLKQLIAVCEAQRQVGETALNDTSSRSHQIIRLTVESSLRENTGCVKSFMASLNFVDLAGSERASQTHAEGARLKEGCHINRSLLTLTKVIRKLSDGRGNSSHIPYRESKLTRILQLSLGGNARTAIICTMSPALSHVEQSRNTLFFATCAKEVTNSAQVNMVVSEKQLVKHLQKEVARLEAELRTPDRSTCTSEALVMEKELKIRQMELEIEELKRQRDLARSELDEELQKKNLKEFLESPHRVAKCLSFPGPMLAPHGDSDTVIIGEPISVNKTRSSTLMRQSQTSSLMLVQEIRKLEQLQEELGEDASRALEMLQKEVACHRQAQAGMNHEVTDNIKKLQEEIRELRAVRSSGACMGGLGNGVDKSVGANLKEELTRLHTHGERENKTCVDNTIATLEEQLENVQKSIDKLVLSLPNNLITDLAPQAKSKKKKKKMLPLSLSNNANRQFIRAPCSPLSSSSMRDLDVETENNPPPENQELVRPGNNLAEAQKATPTKSDCGDDASSREGTPCYQRSNSVDVRKMQKMFKNAAEENINGIRAYVTELKERVAKLQYQKQLLVCQVLKLEEDNELAPADEGVESQNFSELNNRSPSAWKLEFENQRRQIILLWDVCLVSIVHRTQFYLLFKGDPADQIYMEVELRRLTWLEQHFAELGNASPAPFGEEPAISLSSSIRALKHEREVLSKRVNSRFTPEEREMLYLKWDVPLDGKQRKLQLVNKLWTDPNNMLHVQESAAIVAKLVGFCEAGHVSKEMFELNFVLPSDKKPWLLGWNPLSNLLHL